MTNRPNSHRIIRDAILSIDRQRLQHTDMNPTMAKACSCERPFFYRDDDEIRCINCSRRAT